MPPYGPVEEPERAAPTRHTAIGVGLNVLLLAMIAYGFWQSDEWRWAWALVALPIIVVTITYARHLRSSG
jgi:hypothetical protein